jgi:tetratricopeptide (TPR) repeat protein
MFTFSNQTKKLLLVIFILIAISLLFAYFYYDSKNKAEDPRIVETKYLFKKYDKLMKESKFEQALHLLDTIEFFFLTVPGYKTSFEPGIVYNNRGSAYLSMALYANFDSIEKVLFLDMAKKNIDSSISIYSCWLDSFGNLTKNELFKTIIPFFPENEVAFKGKNYNKILNKRVADLILAQNETTRRLSVSYTNQGMVLRHQLKQNEAVEYYIKAIKLWKENYTARNNFNVLMGNPPEDRSIIDQLFPPDKNKF